MSRTSLKRWFGNSTMTSHCDVTNSAQQIQMTTLCHWMKPPMKIFCVRHYSRTTCGPRLWVPDLDLSISSRKNVSRPRLFLIVSRSLHSNKYSIHFSSFFCRILAVQHAQKAFYFCQKLIMIFGGAAQWRTWEGILFTAAFFTSFIVTVFVQMSREFRIK